MTKDAINILLKRKIRKGDVFSRLIEPSKNQKVTLEKGDTFYSVKMMSIWAKTYYRQVAKLAQVLKAEALEKTCENIHHFLYHDLQYQADGQVQNIRSPANSWQNRQVGIDCKSYSIFASCLLLNLGIKHYIRQIKQLSFNPKQFTHVYVVVPKNQQTGDLDTGHYVIDGTIRENKEPNYTAKKDVFMSMKLPHVGLNCPSPRKGLKGAPKKTKGRTTRTNTTKESRKRFPF